LGCAGRRVGWRVGRRDGWRGERRRRAAYHPRYLHRHLRSCALGCDLNSALNSGLNVQVGAEQEEEDEGKDEEDEHCGEEPPQRAAGRGERWRGGRRRGGGRSVQLKGAGLPCSSGAMPEARGKSAALVKAAQSAEGGSRGRRAGGTSSIATVVAGGQPAP
jgi:hypothetical protein